MSTNHRGASRNFLRFSVGALVLAAAFALWNVNPGYSAANEALKPFGEPDTPASFANVIEAVRPAVVNISVDGHQSMVYQGIVPEDPGQGFPFGPEALPPDSPFEGFLRRFFDGPVAADRDVERPFRAMGTGFIIDPDGLVVTNYHVVQSADEISVMLDDGTRYDATLRGHDEKTDLALLEVDAHDLPFVAFGDSDAARVGDWVVAIGNPFGLGGSATTGIISARGRDIQSGPFDDFLQIDAPINRGNSGGPLFDLKGEVIGVTTAIYSPNGGNVGIGFAIPATTVEPVVGALRDDGFVERGWLGVSIQGLDDDLANGLGLDTTHGALVASVVDGSPAAGAGVQPGDVIVGFNDEPVEDARDLVLAVGSSRPDDPAALEVWRDGSRMTLSTHLGTTPGEEPAMDAGAAMEHAPSNLGLRVEGIDARMRRQYRLADGVSGVVVTAVDPRGGAALKGLQPGDVIIGVGQQPVASKAEFDDAIHEAINGGRAAVVLHVQTGDAQRFLALDLS